MTKSNQPVITITDLDQVCIVVRNLDKSMESMWNTFGIGPWYVFIRDCNSTRETDSLTDMTYHGKPARFSYKAAVPQNRLGGMELELVQPITAETIWGDFLRQHGEGVHHIGCYRPASLQAFAETEQTLERAGFPCMMSGRVYGIAFAYFDTIRALNTILEMVWRDPSKNRFPSRVFPE